MNFATKQLHLVPVEHADPAQELSAIEQVAVSLYLPFQIGSRFSANALAPSF
jgi:hypothetical protein